MMEVHIGSSSAKCFRTLLGIVSLSAVAGHCQCIRKETVIAMVGSVFMSAPASRRVVIVATVVVFSRLNYSEKSRLARSVNVSTYFNECLNSIFGFCTRPPK